jgi:hypothetical protein
MAGAFGTLGAIAWWRQRPSAPYLAALALLFVIPALVRPQVLGPIERVWMKFADVLSAVMTRVILTVTFYIVITPIGVLRRLFSKDVFGLRPDPGAATYWMRVDANGPGSRPDKPF